MDDGITVDDGGLLVQYDRRTCIENALDVLNQ
jgi:hypothetical protein